MLAVGDWRGVLSHSRRRTSFVHCGFVCRACSSQRCCRRPTPPPPPPPAAAQARDPIPQLASYMIKNGLASEADIKALEAEVAAEVDDCVEFADASPKPVSVCQPSASQPASQPVSKQASKQQAAGHGWLWVMAAMCVVCRACGVSWVGLGAPGRRVRRGAAARCRPNVCPFRHPPSLPAAGHEPAAGERVCRPQGLWHCRRRALPLPAARLHQRHGAGVVD